MFSPRSSRTYSGAGKIGANKTIGRSWVACPEIGFQVDVEFPPVTQYCLTANKTFSGTRGPSSWSTIFESHLIPPMIFLIFTTVSTSSRKITAPSGLRILSISRRMSSALHLRFVCLFFSSTKLLFIIQWEICFYFVVYFSIAIRVMRRLTIELAILSSLLLV